MKITILNTTQDPIYRKHIQ